MIAGSVFCKVLHSEAIHRKHDSNPQDVAFLEGVLSPLPKKKVKQKLVPYSIKMWHFLEDASLLLTEKKVTLEPLPYTGENISAPSCPHGKLTDHSYL